jgi:hypothetical protein
LWQQLPKPEIKDLLPSDYNQARTKAIIAHMPDDALKMLFADKVLDEKYHQFLSPEKKLKVLF